MQLDIWKFGLGLLVQFAGVLWVASGVVHKANRNTADIQQVYSKMQGIADEQLKRSQNVWTGGAKLESMEKRLDRIEDKIDRLWAVINQER